MPIISGGGSGGSAGGAGSDGWISDGAAGETWTYASATTFTVPTDLTAKYTVGTRIKLTQTTVKYFVVTGSAFGASTTVTITGGADYTLANAAITANYHSYAVNPQGYPTWFNWTPGYTGFTGVTPTLRACKLKLDGRALTLWYSDNGDGTSNATTFTITGMPLTLPASPTFSGCNPTVVNAGTVQLGHAYIQGSQSTINVQSTVNGNPFTNSGSKGMQDFELVCLL